MKCMLPLKHYRTRHARNKNNLHEEREERNGDSIPRRHSSFPSRQKKEKKIQRRLSLPTTAALLYPLPLLLPPPLRAHTHTRTREANPAPPRSRGQARVLKRNVFLKSNIGAPGPPAAARVTSSLKHGHRHHHVAHLRRPASETALSVGVAVGVALRAHPVPWSDVPAAGAAPNARRPRMVAPETHHLARVTVAHAPRTRPIAWMKWMKSVLRRGGGDEERGKEGRGWERCQGRGERRRDEGKHRRSRVIIVIVIDASTSLHHRRIKKSRFLFFVLWKFIRSRV